MLHSLRRRAQAVCVGVAAVGLAVAGTLIATSGPASAGAHSVVPPLDHFLCYQAKAVGFQVSPNLLLKNAVQPAPFSPKFTGVGTHCNPANKSVPVAVFPARNPLAHLFCWNISFQYRPVRVVIANQFGKAIMDTGVSPSKLCLPSWKSNVGPPNMTPNAPPKLDHFTCYPLTFIKGAYNFKVPSVVKAEDEFSAPKYTALKLGIANQLCVPTTKLVAGVVFAPQTPGDLSLVCYPTSPTPFWKLVYDENQFGTGRVSPNNLREEFCLPTTATIG